MAAKKKAAKKTVKTVKKVAKKPVKKAAKRKPNAAFMKPLTLSAALGAVVGAKPIPRTEIVKQLWVYIKKNGLQDKKNRRNINLDDKMKAVFGNKAQITMFDLAKGIGKHVK